MAPRGSWRDESPSSRASTPCLLENATRRSMSATAHPKLGLRPFLPADAALLREIFRDSIEELTSEDYTEAQQEAWASVADNADDFREKLSRQLTLVATLEGSPVGFASLLGKEKIDMLYVHPAAAGQGVG